MAKRAPLPPLLSDRGGFSIMEALIAAAILAIAVTYAAPILLGREYRVRNNNAITSVTLLRINLVNLLQDDDVWNQLLADPLCGPSLDCVKNQQDCSAKSATTNVIPCLRDLTGQKLLDATQPTFGFGLDQKTCTGFVAGGVSFNCPLQYQLTWKPVCTGAVGACKQVPTEVTGTLSLSLSAGAITDPSAYDFTVRH